jgi:hypothetical protein
MGRIECTGDANCGMKQMNMNAGKFDGVYGLSTGMLAKTNLTIPTARRNLNGTRNLASSVTANTQAIENPVMCIE